MKIKLLGLLLLLGLGMCNCTESKAQTIGLTLEDCISYLQNRDEEKLDSKLERLGFIKEEADSGYDHLYKYTSRRNGTVIEVYGAYGDTGGDDYIDIYFPRNYETWEMIHNFLTPKNESEWETEEDGIRYHKKSGVNLQQLGRLVELVLSRDYRDY